MESYTGFAAVYDMFMDNIPYQEWGEYVTELLHDYGITDGLILELGCGTGNLTQILAAKGYDMIAVDNSEDMLQIARDKTEKSNSTDSEILYLLQDMRKFELYGTVKAVVSICDSMNYILEEQDLLQVFKLVNNYLDPKGIFIFDLNTVYKYKEILRDNTIAENRDESSFIWENFYDEEECINEYDLALFIREKDGRYKKYEEVHYQRAYELEKVRELLECAGMEYLCAYEAFTRNEANEKNERIYVIAREQGKNNS